MVKHPYPDAAPLRYVALTGPTAAGKTAAAMAIARAHAVEIVSVDSALVYRGMDIGTAKPSAEERAAVPHHLIDIRDPLQPYSAAEFAVDARRLINDISARGRLPLLVGGTMLYFKALAQGLDAMPPADPAIRAALEAEALASGWPALHAELARVDLITAKRLAPNDSQRIQRALEVYRACGRPISSFHTIKTIADSEDATRATAFISLEPQDRGWLHERIAQRFDAMLATGFLDEVRALRARGDLSAQAPAMRCVGYRQAWEWLDAQEARGPGGLPSIHELRDKGIFATRQLAKRQLTWLRSMPARRVVACDDPTAVQQVLALVQAFQEQRA
ncbi:tRNA (adenosine(37)-N6)-dimethylallyltransferase MiaA [Polaromonas sp. C04]|uniref:tRNA (adenosine(37)-N6)-dimethylallyltransferase MiaA n=1 Tax=Polaromonas sp. C04 TaxID=1945857 RepID=UPI00257051C5|nr:tRNA (adenosine(37)-N6)-dimethylallyltransferase MiaA [Polaromonas sp. C04]